MSLPVAIYSHASDELARQATITLETGTAVATYGLDKLTDDNPARVFKAVETNVGIQFAFAARQPLALLALIHTTLEADDDVVLMGDDAADWDAPAFSMPIVPAGWVGVGATRWPVNTWVDVSAAEGYDEAGYQYYLLACGRTTALSQPLELGQVRLHPTRRTFELDRAPVLRELRPLVEQQTSFGVSTVYDRGTVRFGCKFSMSALFAAERAALEAQWRDVGGRVKPWLFVPDSTEAQCFLVRWLTSQREITRVLQGVSAFGGEVDEVGRGLRPGT